MPICFLRMWSPPSTSFTWVLSERRTTTFPASWVLTVMVAPLRPSITPSIWALCAAATPHSSTSAASDRVTTKAILAVLLRLIILFSYSFSFSCRYHLLESWVDWGRSEEHTSELQSRPHLVCRLLLEKKKK